MGLNKLDLKIQRAEGMLCGLILKEPETLIDNDINIKLLSEEGLFYVGIVDRLYKKGIEIIDEIHFLTEVESVGLKDKYTEMGGYSTIKEMMDIIDIRNTSAIIDEWTKWNLIKKYKNKGILDIDMHWDKLISMTSSQVIDYLEYNVTDVDIDVCSDIDFENLDLTDEEIDEIMSGVNIGINYGKHSSILNYLSMGLPKGDLTMFSSYTNGGKSSFVMNNVVIPISEQKIKLCIVANEQRSIVYKLLLQTYVLTERLNYWKLNRKKFKSGNWSDEDKIMINKARQIIKEEYAPYITFVKLYDYDMKKVNKIAKRLSKRGLECLVYDTMKYSGEDDSVWLSLVEDSKALFQICSKLNLAGVVTLQLYAGTKNKVRTIDESCLSNAKQIAEVFSEMFGFRDIWEDEFDGEAFDIKPYKLKRDSNGKFTSEKEYLNKSEKTQLDKDKKYKIFFHFKTRNDESGKAVLYEFLGYQNKWNELGYCTVSHKNKY
ncbi:MAG: hypothetical protein ACRCVJ_11720 [Clostridium sp.]|uniref:hypothetical protein n=1 Tax=Clostridium sp. TaxID=1506 RepID=UPI003F33BFC0